MAHGSMRESGGDGRIGLFETRTGCVLLLRRGCGRVASRTAGRLTAQPAYPYRPAVELTDPAKTGLEVEMSELREELYVVCSY